MNGSRTIRLGMLTGSPVPYKIPLYRALAQHPAVDFTAIFASTGGLRPYDDGFGRKVVWDSDLSAGYRSIFLKGADRSPILGTSFWSVRDVDIVPVLWREKFDVLWLDGYNSATYLMAVVTQRARGGQLIFREEQTTLHPRSLARTVVKEAALRALFRGHHAMYIGTENRRWFEHYGVAPERLFAAPQAADNDFFREQAQRLRPESQRLRRALGIPDEGGPVVLTVSRLVEKKQPLFLLEVFRRLRRGRRCSLLVVGSGPLEDEMRDTVVSQDIPDVHFAGFMNQSEISQAYACADVFTLLSKEHETFGVVVAEAMNFGLPVVVSEKVGCAADLVSRGLNGDVVSAHDPREAADSLGRLMGDTGLRERMGAASLKRIADWTPQQTVEGIVAAAAAAARRDRV